MTNKWEARERRNKRSALIIAVLLHALVIFLAIQGTGENSVQQWIRQVFNEEQTQARVES